MKVQSTIAIATMLCPLLGCEVPELDVPEKSSSPVAQEPEEKETESKTLFGKEDWYLPDGRVDMSGVEGEPPMTTSSL